MNDVKSLLDTAFNDEPPLRGLRADVVLKQGKARLRTRRLSLAGGVTAGLVGLAFGATLLPGVGSGPLQAASAAPTPAMPAPHCARIASSTPPDGTAYANPQGETASPLTPTKLACLRRFDAVIDDPTRADRLTRAVVDSGILPKDYKVDAIGDRRTAAFAEDPSPHDYGFIIRLIAPDGSRGSLLIEVATADGLDSSPLCSPKTECGTRVVNGQEVQLTSEDYGEFAGSSQSAYARRDDGSKTLVWASNAIPEDPDGMPSPNPDWVPLSADQLVNLVTLPGLKF